MCPGCRWGLARQQAAPEPAVLPQSLLGHTKNRAPCFRPPAGTPVSCGEFSREPEMVGGQSTCPVRRG